MDIYKVPLMRTFMFSAPLQFLLIMYLAPHGSVLHSMLHTHVYCLALHAAPSKLQADTKLCVIGKCFY